MLSSPPPPRSSLFPYTTLFRSYEIPLQAGMSIGMLLVSVELLIMLFILLFVPGDLAGSCFIGFAIGESLGAAARSEEHTSELQSLRHLVCRVRLENRKNRVCGT